MRVAVAPIASPNRGSIFPACTHAFIPWRCQSHVAFTGVFQVEQFGRIDVGKIALVQTDSTSITNLSSQDGQARI